MSTFYLIRHGSTDSAGNVLTGRRKGVHLNPHGRDQAQALPQRFKSVPVDAIYATPLERTQETAAPMANALGLQVQIAEEMTEVNYGDWTGREVRELQMDPLWHRFNSFRSSVTIPGGESMLQIQTRVAGFLERLHREAPSGHFAVISHGDPIKTAVIHYLGMNLDSLFRFVINPASVTIITVTEANACVLTLNNALDGLNEYIVSR